MRYLAKKKKKIIDILKSQSNCHMYMRCLSVRRITSTIFVFLFFQDHVLQKVFDKDLRKNGFSKISRKEEDKESSNSSLSLSLFCRPVIIPRMRKIQRAYLIGEMGKGLFSLIWCGVKHSIN